MVKFVFSNQKLLEFAFSHPLTRSLVRGNLLKISEYNSQTVIDQIYTAIHLSNRTTKESKWDRFVDIDPFTADLLEGFDNPWIHDVGVSSGTTSLALYALLQERGLDCHYTISDKFSLCYYNTEGLATRIYDSEKNLLCGYFGPIFADSESSSLFFLTRWLFRRLSSEKKSSELHESLLYHPKILELIDSKKITHEDYDVFSCPLPKRYSYIRCMNLLNKNYFSDEQIRLGITNLINSLDVRGVLQIGRTVEGANQVSFLRKTESSVEEISHFNGGSEILSTICSIGTSDLSD